jgi:hypothetical protein
MSADNPFNFDVNNWLRTDGAEGDDTGDNVERGKLNEILPPHPEDAHSATIVGATVVKVSTPQNAALVGQNSCIDNGAIGVYGESRGNPAAIGVAGAVDPPC